ncbi:hypothetical protein [Ureibacillus terrenus]|uniref:hypothetical protein n=1 Tax=Ureibacillus terrenus TaxID=118246 RepID=UPI002E224804|nr:hypothetical protein [Ureibacillus terrenus]
MNKNGKKNIPEINKVIETIAIKLMSFFIRFIPITYDWREGNISFFYKFFGQGLWRPHAGKHLELLQGFLRRSISWLGKIGVLLGRIIGWLGGLGFLPGG